MNPNIDPLQLLGKVDAFYKNAWDKLTLWGFILLGVIGFIWPLLLQLIQQWVFKIKEDRLKDVLRKDLYKEFEEKFHVYEENQKKKYDEIISKIEIEAACASAGIFHIQGSNALDGNFYGLALSNYITAASNYINGNDELNLQKVLRLIVEDCLPKLNKKSLRLEECKPEFEKLIDSLTKINGNGRYQLQIKNLLREFKGAVERDPPMLPPPSA